MARSNVWKQRKAMAALKEEFEKNKGLFESNKKVLSEREKVESEFANSKKEWEINKEVIELELMFPRVLNPILEFQTSERWLEASKQAKTFNLGVIERKFKNAEELYKQRIEVLNKIQEQQDRIEIRNKEINKLLEVKQ